MGLIEGEGTPIHKLTGDEARRAQLEILYERLVNPPEGTTGHKTSERQKAKRELQKVVDGKPNYLQRKKGNL